MLIIIVNWTIALSENSEIKPLVNRVMNCKVLVQKEKLVHKTSALTHDFGCSL